MRLHGTAYLFQFFYLPEGPSSLWKAIYKVKAGLDAVCSAYHANFISSGYRGGKSDTGGGQRDK